MKSKNKESEGNLLASIFFLGSITLLIVGAIDENIYLMFGGFLTGVLIVWDSRRK